jgi:hypothetical protein
VTFTAGFFDAEKDASGLVWRWMQQEGVVRVSNTGRDSRLRIRAGAPVAKAVFRVQFNGAPLDEFTADGGDFVKEYQVPAERQGTGSSSEVRITTSQLFTGPNDPRQLGLRVFEIDWAAQ